MKQWYAVYVFLYFRVLLWEDDPAKSEKINGLHTSTDTKDPLDRHGLDIDPTRKCQIDVDPMVFGMLVLTSLEYCLLNGCDMISVSCNMNQVTV